METLETMILNRIENGENEKEQRLNHAAYELSDGIWHMVFNLKKAGLLIQDITDDYFEKHSPAKKDNQWEICFEFERYRIVANMISDYVYAAETIVSTLDKRVKDYMKTKKEVVSA